MAFWFTSDLHFGHQNVIEYCKRPFQSVDEMNEKLVEEWNRIVEPKDLVYALGDMCFLKPTLGVPMMQRLKGKKVLIQGNHDKYSYAQYTKAGFEVIAREILVKIQGIKFRLSHYPYAPDHAETRPTMVRYLNRRPLRKEGEWLLHGHVHEHWKIKDNQINVGVDQWNMRPVSEDEIVKLVMLTTNQRAASLANNSQPNG